MARQWVLKFVTWYNGEHLHSGLSFVTPEQRHSGVADAVLKQRREVYTRARERHPLRWKLPPRARHVSRRHAASMPPARGVEWRRPTDVAARRPRRGPPVERRAEAINSTSRPDWCESL
jgi:hypothetical protein